MTKQFPYQNLPQENKKSQQNNCFEKKQTNCASIFPEQSNFCTTISSRVVPFSIHECPI